MIDPKAKVSFIFCVFSGLLLGTNYCFSSWSPQFALRCHLSALEINLVGISGNLGVYLVSPFSGRLVDKTGQRIPLLLSAIFLFFGYLGLHTAFEQAWQERAILMCLFSSLTGIGSSLGNSAVLNACAKAHPDHRGTATAFPIATYGLSAFVFSRISYLVYPGRTSKFLLALSISCGAALALASCFVGVYGQPIEIVASGRSSSNESEETGALLCESPDDDDDERCQEYMESDQVPEITGFSLFADRDFQLMITTLALLSGTGLMWINNVGTNLIALVRAEYLPEPFPTTALEKLQAFNVSLLSLMNCVGRIFAGLTSDYILHRYGIPRTIYLVISSTFFTISCCFVVLNHSSVNITYCTSLLGFSYGCLFGISPVITSEMFGLKNFSSNWGFMSVAPGVSGNVFNLLYGKVYDYHSDPATHECTEGLACFKDAFIFAAIGTLLALASSIWLYMRHHSARKVLSMAER